MFSAVSVRYLQPCHRDVLGFVTEIPSAVLGEGQAGCEKKALLHRAVGMEQAAQGTVPSARVQGVSGYCSQT